MAKPSEWRKSYDTHHELADAGYWTELKGDSPFILVKCAFSRIFVKNRIVLSTNEAWRNYRSAWQNRSDFLSFVEERTVSIFPSLIIHSCFLSCLTLTYSGASLGRRTRVFALLGPWRSVLLDPKHTNDGQWYSGCVMKVLEKKSSASITVVHY